MSRKGRTVTLSLSERDKSELEALALEFGKKWGDRPNISKLVEAIARQQLQIAPNHDWSDARIQALERARNDAIDAGHLEEAIAIAKLLRDRGELSIPLRNQIEAFLGNPPPPWRLEIDRHIKRREPFQLLYQDAMGRPWQFTVRHAEIVPHEERQYLDCWCDETEGNLDIEPLRHNWCLRLDRIPEAAVRPVSGPWRPDLDRISVEVHLHNRLAFSYKTRSADESETWLEENPKIKQVHRRISNTYWFVREVLQNAPDMVVIAPESIREAVREKIREKVRSLCHHYDIDIPEP